jgi:pSer/pThr/pTyr-binding forkhead associated (FHA) protein
LALPQDRTITISVIKGASKGAAHRLIKARTSIGKIGGSADTQIDDPGASGLHCAVALAGNAVRLCDLDSAKGTFVDDKRIQATDLEHLSEFRIGSSLLLLTIVPKHIVDSA